MLFCPDPTLHQALNYALSTPGKQLRKQLTLMTAKMLTDAPPSGTNTVAEAIEWLHTYSLIHDDLPAMDDDCLRRGQPTVHVQFNEATAILVGDGLQAAAFGAISRAPELSPEQRLALITLLAEAVGFGGMVGGQALDMSGQNSLRSLDDLRQMHALKTGALITAAVVAGATCAHATDSALASLRTFGDAIGLAFQVMDDVIDVTQDSATLGKTAGKDDEANKSTYVRLLGLTGAKDEAERLLAEALGALDGFGTAANPLKELARAMVYRNR
jgi:geranylgeranyl pyrophosphate synthase